METRQVRHLMVPLEIYPTVPDSASLLDAIMALRDAQAALPPGRQPHRAVLVVDDRQNVVGKVGQLSFLRGLEPKYSLLGDLGTLSRAGVSTEFVSSMMKHYRFFQSDVNDLRDRSRATPVRDIMHPVSESISDEASLKEAMHQIIVAQTLSILVTRQGRPVGLLRLSDLFEEISARVISSQGDDGGSTGDDTWPES